MIVFRESINLMLVTVLMTSLAGWFWSLSPSM